MLVSIEASQVRAANTKRYYRRGAKLLDATALREFPLDKLTKSVVAAVKFPIRPKPPTMQFAP